LANRAAETAILPNTAGGHYLVSCRIFYANGWLALAELDNSLKLRVKAEYEDLDTLPQYVAPALSTFGELGKSGWLKARCRIAAGKGRTGRARRGL
jgi:hypothetical protein